MAVPRLSAVSIPLQRSSLLPQHGSYNLTLPASPAAGSKHPLQKSSTASGSEQDRSKGEVRETQRPCSGRGALAVGQRSHYSQTEFLVWKGLGWCNCYSRCPAGTVSLSHQFCSRVMNVIARSSASSLFLQPSQWFFRLPDNLFKQA